MENVHHHWLKPGAFAATNRVNYVHDYTDTGTDDTGGPGSSVPLGPIQGDQRIGGGPKAHC